MKIGRPWELCRQVKTVLRLILMANFKDTFMPKI